MRTIRRNRPRLKSNPSARRPLRPLDVDALIAAVTGRGPRIPEPDYEVVFRPDGHRDFFVELSRGPLPHEERILALAIAEFAHAKGVPVKVAAIIQDPDDSDGDEQ